MGYPWRILEWFARRRRPCVLSTRQTLRLGLFARTPAVDWALQHGFIDHAVFYAPQRGDPHETAASIVERDLTAGTTDAAILWGPIAGFLVSHQSEAAAAGGAWIAVPFRSDPRIKFDYAMAVGVRFGAQPWKDTLDAWIVSHRGIEQILRSYHIPLIDSPSPQG